ncbi:MAG: HlyD family efflux transporter periplasmic adaptor subunit [Pirellulaceae bacterium]
MATQVDLRQLAVERPGSSGAPLVRKRGWLVKWGLPLTILAGFAALMGWSARDQWLPAKPVTVVPVILTRAEVQQAGTPLFQAAGWVEPRPTAVMASALVEGVVEQLLVVEGQEVQAGQPIAKLMDADARIALQEAEANRQLRVAERDAIQAALTAAEQNAEHPVHLQAALADADVVRAELNTEIKNLPFALKAAQSRLQLARQDLEGKLSVGDALAGRVVQKAQSEFDAANAAVEELRARAPSLEAQREACSRKCDALETRLSLKTDEKRALQEARANRAGAEAKLAQARLAVDSAQLRLERMTVRSPIAGRVLALNAQPGQRLMGMNVASERDASTVASLYDPQQLQIRADVRLEDVPQVLVGQPVQISTAASGKPLTGRVLAATSQADIQKNTLSVKVSIDDPPLVIKPEMLAQVTFLAAETPGSKPTGEQDPIRLLVARELVETADGGSTVWVADSAEGVARRRAIQLGRAGTGQLVEVTQGLTALDKLIVGGREGLEDGDRIRVTGQDRALGAATGQAVTTVAAGDRVKQ